jgi:hypothetical protein
MNHNKLHKCKGWEILSLIILSLTLQIISIFSIYSFLIREKEIRGKFLIVEGWIPTHAIYEATEEFKNNSYDCILTTGGSLKEELIMHSNGCLNIYLNINTCEIKLNSTNRVTIYACGTPCNHIFPEMKLIVNQDTIGSVGVGKNQKGYSFEITTHDIDSIILVYSNDYFNRFSDRNLYIHKIELNNYSISVRSPGIYYCYYQNNRKIKEETILGNYADLAKSRLIQFGIPDSLIISLPSLNISKLRTYSSAITVSDYIKHQVPTTESVTVYSYDVHSRRTFLSYKKAFNNDIKIGLLNTRNKDYNCYNWFIDKNGIFNICKEILGLIYLQLFLI